MTVTLQLHMGGCPTGCCHGYFELKCKKQTLGNCSVKIISMSFHQIRKQFSHRSRSTGTFWQTHLPVPIQKFVALYWFCKSAHTPANSLRPRDNHSLHLGTLVVTEPAARLDTSYLRNLTNRYPRPSNKLHHRCSLFLQMAPDMVSHSKYFFFTIQPMKGTHSR